MGADGRFVSGRLRPALGDELVVRFDRLAYGGEAVGRHEGLVVFALGVAPGERARVSVTGLHRRHLQAEVVEVLEAAPDRVAPPCPHFAQGCGGCTWQYLSYSCQVESKAALVRESLEHLGGLCSLPIRPAIPAPEPWHYRNKMEFAFHPDGLLGLHPRGAWDRILPLESCFLQPPLATRIVQAAQSFVAQAGIPLYHPRTRQGLLRELVVRHSRASGETMLGIVTGPQPFAAGPQMARTLAAVDAGISSIVHGVRATADTAAPLCESAVLYGQDHITELVDDLRFRIDLGTFFQTNSAQAERLVRLVRELAGDLAGALVIDVYCGVGLFSLALARAARAVVGIEVVPAAVRAAQVNAKANRVENVHFFAGDARKVLPEVLASHGTPDVAVLDPPRAGAGGKVMRRIARSAPRRIVYVSCNPTTLARDLRELLPFGYRVTAVQPIDLFPQTYHVETLVALERRGNAEQPCGPASGR